MQIKKINSLQVTIIQFKSKKQRNQNQKIQLDQRFRTNLFLTFSRLQFERKHEDALFFTCVSK